MICPAPASAEHSDAAVFLAHLYYTGDLEALHEAGAELVPFSPLRDRSLPSCDGLFLGGGFPETHMAALESNADMRADIARFVENDNPVYAECGGLMYLCDSLTWNGNTCRMAGVIPVGVHMHARPQGRGYVPAEENQTDDLDVGFIPVDSAFSPVRDVFDPQGVRDTRSETELREDRRRILGMMQGTTSDLVVELGTTALNLETVLALGEGGFAVLPGDTEWGFTCFAQGPLLVGGALLLDVGDFDGDGVAEFATLTETGAPVAYDVSWGP